MISWKQPPPPMLPPTQGYSEMLKLVRCPHSLIASLATFTLITRTPPCLRQLPSCVAVYPRDTDRDVFYVSHPIRSIDALAPARLICSPHRLDRPSRSFPRLGSRAGRRDLPSSDYGMATKFAVISGVHDIKFCDEPPISDRAS